MGPDPLVPDRGLQSGVDAIALPLALTGVSGRIDHWRWISDARVCSWMNLTTPRWMSWATGWDGEAS